MAKAAAAYCAQVNKYLTCPSSMKRPFLRQLKEEIDFYCEEHGEQEVQGLYAAFGTPETIAGEFLSELSTKTVASCTARRKRILAAALIVAVIAVMAAGILGLQSHTMQQKIDDDNFIASVIYKEEAQNRSLWSTWQEVVFGHTDKIE